MLRRGKISQGRHLWISQMTTCQTEIIRPEKREREKTWCNERCKWTRLMATGSDRRCSMTLHRQGAWRIRGQRGRGRELIRDVDLCACMVVYMCACACMDTSLQSTLPCQHTLTRKKPQCTHTVCSSSSPSDSIWTSVVWAIRIAACMAWTLAAELKMTLVTIRRKIGRAQHKIRTTITIQPIIAPPILTG